MLPILRLAKLGLGGKQGSGQQWGSWLHVDDFCGIVCAVIDGQLKGELYNCASPHPVQNHDFMRAIRAGVGGFARYLGLPTPKLLLKLGAFMIRTETELVLKSRKVAPQNLLDADFAFKHPELEAALQTIVDRVERKVVANSQLKAV